MLTLLQVPVWQDNYAYVVVHDRRAFVVDSPEAGPVLAWLDGHPDVQLQAVVNTHHHGDHVGSNRELVLATGCEVVGPAHDRARIPGLTRGAEVGSTIEVAGVPLRVLDVRAHTRGHVAYACDLPFDEVVRHGHAQGAAPAAIERLADRPALFVGDSLFLGGCGRLFEGTPHDLAASMEVLAAERSEALVCCAHEYTRSNLAFAAHVLPHDEGIATRLRSLRDEQGGSASSVPDTLERERQTNPFLLCLDPERRAEIARGLGIEDEGVVPVLAALRAAKDRFRTAR